MFQDYIQSNSNISRRGPDVCNSHKSTLWSSVEALFAGFVLHLRGHLTEQPVQDKEGNILLWNGEIFAGMEVKSYYTHLLVHVLLYIVTLS